jgi:hypothetical protein
MLDNQKNNLQEINEDVTLESQENTTEIEKENQTKKIITDDSDIKPEGEVLNEIDEKLAKSSEKEEDLNEETIPKYDEMKLETLVENLNELLKNNPVQKINNNVNSIKNAFDSKFSIILAEKKAAFLAEGGDSIDFSYSNPLKIEFNTLIKSFRDNRTKHYKNVESELTSNLELRISTIEQLKELIETADTKTMYNKFRDLQEKWKKIGPVPREKYNNTWRTFHHHVERFYDLLHMSNDFRDLDFKHNLGEKLKLVSQAEKLAESEDVNYAFKQLQILHKMWKEDVGPVAREFREDIWNKFSVATKKIHDKRHENFKKLKGKYEDNIAKKIEIIELINSIDLSKNTKHSDWQESIKNLEDLRQQFFKAGNVPKSESEKIWTSFKEATRKFNKEKNSFYKNVKNVQQENLNKKNELIALAQKHKDSEDWDATTEVMKKIQSDWKKIGHVPRKYSDKIWNEFKSACNHYFDRYHVYQNKGSEAEQEIYTKKKELLTAIKSNTNKDITLDGVKDYIKSWRSFGRVPYNLRHIESDFSKQLDKLFSNLSIDKNEKEKIKFENQMEGYLTDKNFRKLDNEQIFIRKKIDESVKEIQQLENNMSFFSDKDQENPLLKNVVKNIESHKSNLSILKMKLSYLSQLDY